MLLSLTSVLATIASAMSIAKKSGIDIESTLKDNKKLRTLSANGNSMNLISRMILEPLVITTQRSKKIEVYDKVVERNLDLFTVVYTQSFKYLFEVAGYDADTTYNLLASKRFTGSVDAISSMITTETEHLPLNLGTATFESDNKGKMVNGLTRDLTFKVSPRNTDNNDLNVSVMVAAVVETVNTKQLVDAFINKSHKNTLSYMWDEYRSGGSSLTDLIMGKRIVDDYRKNKFKDVTDIESIVDKRSSDATKSLFLDGATGFSTYYQMIILTTSELEDLEKKTGRRLSKHHEFFLEKLKSMSITVIDEDYELVTTYISNITKPLESSFNSLKSKSKGVDINDISKLLTQRMI